MRRLTENLRVTLRTFARAPAFPATAILILCVGIGMAVAMFTIFDTVLLRPLPVRDQDRIVLPRIVDPHGIDLAMTSEEYRRLASESGAPSDVAAEAHQGAFATVLLDGDRSLVLKAAWVTGNFFDLLGARPALGRLFHVEDESPREAAVLVISFDTWRRRFGADSAIIGHQVTNPYTLRRYVIVGVAPAGLAYPVGAEYWMPQVYGGGLDAIVRLAPTTASTAARPEFLSLMRRIYQEHPGRMVAGASSRTLAQAVAGGIGPTLRVVSAAVALLLLIACLNVGNLLLLRLAARRHELAIRRSLGAGSADILSQVLGESAVLAVVGGGLGLALAKTTLVMLPALVPTMPRLDSVGLVGTPLGAAVAVTVLAVIAIGVLPAFAVTRGSLGSPLRRDARSGSGGVEHHRIRQWLVASQVALAVVMLAGAGLLVRSLERLQRIDLGYRADHLSLLQVAIPVPAGGVETKFALLLDKAPSALRALAGVTSVTPIVAPPFFGPQIFNAPWEVDGEPPASASLAPRIPIEAGGPEYFRAFEIPILRGRGFLETDRSNSPDVAVVSVTAARLLWPGRDPIGQRIRIAGDTNADNLWRTVVGVAGDIRYRVLREPTPTIYLPSPQYFFQGAIAVRTTRSLADALPAMRRAVHDAYPGAEIVRFETMDELLGGQLAQPRMSASLLSGFGLVALLLAAVGLYGVIAYAVRERTHELGVRAALGATPWRLRRDVLRQALALWAAGALVGLAVALAVSRLLASLLFEVSPADPVTMLGACGLLLAVVLIAADAPARRATRIDPATALRAD